MRPVAANGFTVPSRPVKRRDKVAEVIARDILRRIREEGLEVGAQLPTEAQMISEYAVGRGTLREALRILEIPGLITIRSGPRGGPVVAGANADDFGRMATLFFQMGGMTFRELIEARLILEPVTTRLAAERQDPADLARLREFLDVAYTTDEAAYRTTTADFHQLIPGMSGNGIVCLFALALARVFHDRVDGILFPTTRRRKEVFDAHAQIAQAIIDGDAVAAERIMYEHMEKYVNYVKSKYPDLLDEVVDWR